MVEIIIKYWIEFIFGILISTIGYLSKQIKNYYKSLESTRRGVLVLLKMQILEKYKEYKILGSISIYDGEIINELYQEYKNLGGNGLIQKMIDDMEEISVSKCTGGE